MIHDMESMETEAPVAGCRAGIHSGSFEHSEAGDAVTDALPVPDTCAAAEAEIAGVHPPQYDFSSPPRMIATSTETEFEWGNFLKGCKWSPDGTCLLTCSEDNALRLFELPRDGNEGEANTQVMEPALRMREGETVYDYCWYPLMNVAEPATACVLSTSRDHPAHLWDAFTGTVRATYRSYNHVDEITAPSSLSFSLDGQKILCGFERAIRVFDTGRPGRDCRMISTVRKGYGQKGLISCMASSPVQPDYLAAGSYGRSVGLYDMRSDGALVCLVDVAAGVEAGGACRATGGGCGVTRLHFSPDGSLLYVGCRKAPFILVYDTRYLDSVVGIMHRPVSTNQRVDFDVDPHGRFVVSGTQDGCVSFFFPGGDVLHSDAYGASGVAAGVDSSVFHSFQAHCDSVNGVAVHPYLPLLATASGQRKFSLPANVHAASDISGETGGATDDANDAEWQDANYNDVRRCDNSVRLWSLGSCCNGSAAP